MDVRRPQAREDVDELIEQFVFEDGCDVIGPEQLRFYNADEQTAIRRLNDLITYLCDCFDPRHGPPNQRDELLLQATVRLLASIRVKRLVGEVFSEV